MKVTEVPNEIKVSFGKKVAENIANANRLAEHFRAEYKKAEEAKNALVESVLLTSSKLDSLQGYDLQGFDLENGVAILIKK